MAVRMESRMAGWSVSSTRLISAAASGRLVQGAVMRPAAGSHRSDLSGKPGAVFLAEVLDEARDVLRQAA